MFDPTLPKEHTLADAAQMRAQLKGLKDLIDAVPTISGAVIDGVTTVPAGQPATVNVSLAGGVLHFSFQVPQGQEGQQGPVGPPLANLVVDGVTTLNPGDAAQANASFDGSNVHLSFGIPRGNDGASATPVTTFLVDAVNTLNPGDNATVQASFDGSAVHFVFNIPRGNDGTNGSNGTNGNDGSQGPAGAPFTNFVIDGVNMLNPTDPASVQTSFDGSAVRLVFNIPRGFTGNDGANGSNGLNGSDGPPGPMGPAFTNIVVDGVNMLPPTDPASAQATFDGSAVRLLFNLPRGFTGNDGSAGPQGPVGPAFTNFVVDGVNTVAPTDPASVQTSFDGNAVRLVFNIPRGFTGNDGSNGMNGSDGAQGPAGPQGPPFANAVVDSVSTLNPGDSATVQTTFDGSNVRFQFGIPRGFTGNDGMNGSDGAPGPEGPPGEVTTAQLSSAIAGTSSNSNAVSTLGLSVSDPPTQSEVQAIANKLDELIAALRR